MIEVLQETTDWGDAPVANGIYHVNASGHLVQHNDKKFKSPIKGFDKRGRKFNKIEFDKRGRKFNKIDQYEDLSQPKTSNVIIVQGSKGNTYTIEDGKCSCPGFTYRGTCKHVKAVA